MFMDINGIDLFDQNVGIACAEVRHRCLMNITGIDLFDQNEGMTCTEAKLRCSLISLVLIYFIKMWIWRVLRLDTDVYGYHWY